MFRSEEFLGKTPEDDLRTGMFPATGRRGDRPLEAFLKKDERTQAKDWVRSQNPEDSLTRRG